MNSKNWYLSCLLILSMVLSLVACDDKVDFSKKKLTTENIKTDLVNQSISGLSEGAFKIGALGYVALIDVKYDEDKSLAKVFVKAIDVESKTGIEGTLDLQYKAGTDSWNLQTIAPRSVEMIDKAYAIRLSELVASPLHFAANIGDFERVEIELKKGVFVDTPEEKKQSTALMFAAERGSLDIVKQLIKSGADCNYKNKHGLTALHATAYQNHYQVAKYLVEKGADINAKDEAGRTPLYLAAESSSPELVKYMIENGADVNERSHKHGTPLYAAAVNDSFELVKYLIEHGAEVNSKTEEGRHSPLLFAAYNNNVEMVELLLQKGADTSAKLSKMHSRFRGQTALDLARERGNEAVVELLEKAGK